MQTQESLVIGQTTMLNPQNHSFRHHADVLSVNKENQFADSANNVSLSYGSLHCMPLHYGILI